MKSSCASSPKAIAIVGGGFSGSLVATHLLTNAHHPLKVFLIERGTDIGQGIAYGTPHKEHLLNVPVGKMSAFPEDPDHLLRWLRSNPAAWEDVLDKDDINAHAFVPRLIFGRYVQSILKDAEANSVDTVTLERVFDEAIAIAPKDHKACITLASGATLWADRVVLAIGNMPMDLPHPPSPYLRHAWARDAIDELSTDATVLLLGTGLTMVDILLSLYNRGHCGKIYALSRRGLTPLSHQPLQTPASYSLFISPELAPATVRQLTQKLRHEVRIALDHGQDWRLVVDALRPTLQQLWQKLSSTEQQRFLRHLAPYWDVHRHRLAPAVANCLEKLQASGQFTIMAGRVLGYTEISGSLNVRFRRRHQTQEEIISVNRIIDCTGAQVDYRRLSHPLVNSLLYQGLIQPNPLGLGINTASDGSVLDAQNRPSSYLYTIGTPRKGDLWETSSVPELRVQARSLALSLLKFLFTEALSSTSPMFSDICAPV